MKYFLVLFSIVSLHIDGIMAKPPKVSKTKPKPNEWVVPYKASVSKIIYGNWLWIETDCCGVRHGLSNPNSTNDSIVLNLNVDNSFLETHTKPSTLPRNGNFILFKENNMDMVQFNDERPAKYSISDNNDTLILSWKHLELQTEKYLRKK